jgi:hypothetical protein
MHLAPVTEGDTDHAIRILANPSIPGSDREELTSAEFRRQLFEVVRPELLQRLTQFLVRQFFPLKGFES